MLFTKKKKRKKQEKPRLSAREYRKTKRLEKLKPSTQDTLRFERLYDNGLIKIGDKKFSRQYRLNDVAYEAAGENQQDGVVLSYAKALNSLDHHDAFELTVVNERVGERAIENLLMPLTSDKNDVYRSEINQIMAQKFTTSENEFQVRRYITLSADSRSAEEGDKDINKAAKDFTQRFQENGIDLRFESLSGKQRAHVLNFMTNPGDELPIRSLDMAKSNKDAVASRTMHIDSGYLKINEKFARIMYIHDYPKLMEDKLIRELLRLNREMVISIHAEPYNMQDTKRKVNSIATQNKIDMRRQQKDNFKDGIGEDMLSGAALEIKDSTAALQADFKDNTQKLFSGTFTIMVMADSKEDLRTATTDIKGVGQGQGVNIESVYNYQEEGFNTVLPIGHAVLNELPTKEFMRDMTTLNVATQVPFTSVELQSPHGEFFGQNQISKNLITIDRKNRDELITPSGLILGSSGSGKSVATKYQILNTLLNHPDDRIVIVDPESEYLPIGRALGAEILDISTGTDNHLNILDLPNRDDLDSEDRKLDLYKEKTNLLISLLSDVMPLTPGERGIIDRVTQMTYERYPKPTLMDWQDVLDQQEDVAAEELSNAMFPYTKGAQNIFAYDTNIDLSNRFIIFNTKSLDSTMKPFAMKVILDQIWKQVVSYQNKATTWLYFDEIQVNFETEANAQWFTNLWARVRKYGAIPTGITQNVITLLGNDAGQKMVSNTEFMILLRQKGPDLQKMSDVLGYDSVLLNQFCGGRPPKGTGLIQVDGVMIPFENEIPKNTKLFELLNTDVRA